MLMMSVEDARSTIRQSLQPLPPRRAHLAENVGATLAESLCTSTALPPADVSAMDGYAVRGDGPWILRSEIQVAGPTLVRPLRQGEAIRIGTGARVPAGSTMVIRDEYVTDTTIFGKLGVAHLPEAPIRDDTRRRGENWPSGAELAPSGHRVSLAMVSAAVSAETPTAELRGPLRARVILTGNEIRTQGRLAPGQTRDSLGPVLPQYLRALDITCAEVIHVPDRSDQIRDLITAADAVDLVVVVGATRHGPADHLRLALQAAGADTIVDGVSCQPAGSQLTAQIPGGPTVLCLPGNPYAAIASLLITAPTIVEALTSRVRGTRTLGHIADTCDLATNDTTRILPATRRPDGNWDVDSKVRTPHLAGLIARDALALVPPRPDRARLIELIDIPP
jgi:molybdopterin molybdotransferase